MFDEIVTGAPQIIVLLRFIIKQRGGQLMKKRREVTSDPPTPVTQVNKLEKHICPLSFSSGMRHWDQTSNDSYQCLAGAELAGPASLFQTWSRLPNLQMLARGSTI